MFICNSNELDMYLFVDVVVGVCLVGLELHDGPEKLLSLRVVLEHRQHDLPHVSLEAEQLKNLKKLWIKFGIKIYI